MKEGQKEIYYLLGPNRAAIEAGPYLEGFKARNLEVLFCYEAVDEYVMNNVREFDGKTIRRRRSFRHQARRSAEAARRRNSLH